MDPRLSELEDDDCEACASLLSKFSTYLRHTRSV